VIFSSPNYRPKGHAENYQNQSELRADVHNEIVMIPESDAVVDPRTVVIKPFNTLVAHSTVTRSGSADGFTVRTKLCTFNSSNEISKVYFILNIAWLSTIY